MSSYKPGQHLVCTVTKVPLAENTQDTIARLMRLDPANKKALRRAQRMRRQRMVVYNRGNRDWYSREKSAKVVHVLPGATFTLPFTLALVGDLANVSKYISVKAK
jgi:hypothetical protein